MAGRTSANGSGAAAPPVSRQHDPVQWMRYYWEQQNQDDPTGFLAMTSVLRLHHLMTTAVDGRLKAEFKIS